MRWGIGGGEEVVEGEGVVFVVVGGRVGRELDFVGRVWC